MNKIVEFDTLKGFLSACEQRELVVKSRSGSGEDPFTHYSAYVPHTDNQIGYFGDANGADNDFGVIGNTKGDFDRWIGY